MAGCVPVPRQVGGAVGPQPRQQRVVGVGENLLVVTLSLEVTEQKRQFSDTPRAQINTKTKKHMTNEQKSN